MNEIDQLFILFADDSYTISRLMDSTTIVDKYFVCVVRGGGRGRI